MKRYVLRFPGDPPAAVTKMTRAEFLGAFPRTPVVITDYDAGTREVFPLGPDEVSCDLCGADPGDTVYVLGNGLRGVCEECFREGWLSYCKPVGEG